MVYCTGYMKKDIYQKTRKMIRRERCCIMGTAHMKMRTGDARIANECENIQHGNGYGNVPIKYETTADKQTESERAISKEPIG